MRQPNISLVLAQRREIDRIALANLLEKQPDLSVVGSSISLNEFSRFCCDQCPDVAILDASYAAESSFKIAKEILQKRWTRGIMFLDDEVRFGNVRQALQFTMACYYGKSANFADIYWAIRKLNEGEISHDPSLRGKLVPGKRIKSLRLRYDGPSTDDLTKRELEVMKLLVQGKTVREVATFLDRSVNTIDNHKTRLMKKLRVHRTTHLIQIAMREGLVERSMEY